jgi:hypothetical protein
MLAKLDYRLSKTPARSWLRPYYGPGYQVLRNNYVVAGCGSCKYRMSIEEVEDFAVAAARKASQPICPRLPRAARAVPER